MCESNGFEREMRRNRKYLEHIVATYMWNICNIQIRTVATYV
jgi:hypothetical protein